MKFTQLKWIGLAVLATSLSAGGLVAVAYAAALRQEAAPTGDSAAVVFHGDGQEQTETPTEKRVKEIEQRIELLLKDIDFYPFDGSLGGRAGDGSLATKVLKRKLGPLLNGGGTADGTTEARLKTLEDKIDRLAARLGTPSTPAGLPVGAATPDPRPREVPSYNRTAGPQPSRSRPEQAAAPAPIGELEAELKLAIDEHSRTLQLVQRAVVGESALLRAGGKVLIIAAQVEALDDDLKDELDRLQLERRRKAALLDKARAEEEMAGALVARDRRLNQRKPGIVDQETVAKTEGQSKAAAS